MIDYPPEFQEQLDAHITFRRSQEQWNSVDGLVEQTRLLKAIWPLLPGGFEMDPRSFWITKIVNTSTKYQRLTIRISPKDYDVVCGEHRCETTHPMIAAMAALTFLA